MNIPAIEDRARAALDAAASLAANAETQVLLFASPAAGEFDVRRINPTQPVANRFREIAAAWAAALHHRTLVPYAPGRKPDAHELAFLRVEGVEPISGLLQSIEQPIDIQLFEVAFARRLRFYVVAVRQPNPGWIHFFKAKGETIRLKRTNKVALVPSAGAYAELEEDPLVFDTSFDAVVSDGFALVANQGAFERALQFIEQASAAARVTLGELLANVAVTNADDFLAAAASDVNMIAKLRSIAEKMAMNPAYAEAMTTDRLIEFADERGIAVDTHEIDGERRFLFHPDPQHRWRILKLLDDDYLHSTLTEIDYEVNSKSQLEQ